MAFFSDLKEALGSLARLKAGYTPEVIQKKQALARLGELDLKGKLLEHESKVEQLAQLRANAERARANATAANFERAVNLQSQLPSSEDPSFVGPRLEDAGMSNPGGEGLLPGYDTASEVYNIPEEMRPMVRSVGGGIRDRAATKERRESQKFEADLAYKESQENLNEARASAAERSNRGGDSAGRLTPAEEAALINRLQIQWDKTNQPAKELRRQLTLMDAGLNAARRGDLAAGAQAILVTFQKVLDPPSVVRESEYDRSAAGLALKDRVAGYVERLAQGGAGIPLTQLEQFAKLAREATIAQLKGAQASSKNRITRTLTRYGLSTDLVFDGADIGPDSFAEVGPPSPSAPGVTSNIAGRYNPKTGRIE